MCCVHVSDGKMSHTIVEHSFVAVTGVFVICISRSIAGFPFEIDTKQKNKCKRFEETIIAHRDRLQIGINCNSNCNCNLVAFQLSILFCLSVCFRSNEIGFFHLCFVCNYNWRHVSFLKLRIPLVNVVILVSRRTWCNSIFTRKHRFI